MLFYKKIYLKQWVDMQFLSGGVACTRLLPRESDVSGNTGNSSDHGGVRSGMHQNQGRQDS
jgi:hypothetical protein